MGWEWNEPSPSIPSVGWTCSIQSCWDLSSRTPATLYLLLDMVSFEAALARPLTPAVRAGSILLLLDCALNLPHVFGFKLARKEDLGDWVVVGLLAWLSTLSSSLGGEYFGLLGPRFGSRFLLRTSLNRLLHGKTMMKLVITTQGPSYNWTFNLDFKMSQQFSLT